MKKFISLIVIVSMLATIFVGCSNENQPNISEDENPGIVDSVENEGQNDDTIIVDETLDIVVDGSSEYVIVRGENASPSEITASTELQKYLKQISGVELPIVSDNVSAVEKEIIVGKTNRESEGEFDRDELGTDGFVIKSKGDKIYLVGGEQRGTLYSVFEFLESYLGCRFYTSKFEKIPETKTISLNKIEEDKQIPVFDTRTVHWADYSSNDYFSAKRKTIICKWGIASESYGGNPTWIRIGSDVVHSLGTLAETGREGQPCLTDENTYNTVLKNVRTLLAENPDYDIISVSQNDNDDYCSCENCSAKVSEYGNMGGVNLWFVNRIADAIKDEFPNVTIHTFAYRYTRHVPTGIKPADNVTVELCSIEACFRHPLAECTEYSGESFVDLLNGWGELCDNLYIWDYTTNYSNYVMTFPNFEVLRDNLKLFADSGVAHVLEQGNYSTVDSGEFGELRCYLLSHLLWDPYMSDEEVKALMVEFMQDFYGPGWESVYEYLNLALELTKDTCFDIYEDPDKVYPWPKAVQLHEQKSYPDDLTADMIRNYETVDWSKYWNWFRGYADGDVPAIITEGYRLFADALSKAETEEQKKNVDRASLQVDYINSWYMVKNHGFGSSAMGKIMINYFNANPDEFTAQEKDDFRIAIVKYSRELAGGKIEAYNRALAEKLLSYGITCVREGRFINDFSVLDFMEYPQDW